MSDSLEILPPASRIPYFTKENAKEMALRGKISKQLKRQMLVKLMPEDETPANPYLAFRLVRTRALINSLEYRLTRCKAPRDIERLSRSIGVLSELERNLAGRPAAGQYRPKLPREAGSTGILEMEKPCKG
jgi:lipopolysaccharide biosynthesis protein